MFNLQLAIIKLSCLAWVLLQLSVVIMVHANTQSHSHGHIQSQTQTETQTETQTQTQTQTQTEAQAQTRGQLRGEYVLFLGDTLDRNGIRDYCEFHGSQHGTQYQLDFHNNNTVSSMMGFSCENRFGDVLTHVHLFNSEVEDENESAIYNISDPNSSPGSTASRILQALTLFREKYPHRRQPDKIVLHTSHWDRSFPQFAPFLTSQEKHKLDNTFANDEGAVIFYHHMKILVKFIKTTLLADEIEAMKQKNDRFDQDSQQDQQFSNTSQTIRRNRLLKTRIILRSSPLPVLKDIADPLNVTLGYFNAISKQVAHEENLEFYDYDADIWSIADYQCGCRDSFYHSLFFRDDIHPNRVLSSRYIEKILGLRFTRFYYDYRYQFSPSSPGNSMPLHLNMFVPRLELCENSPRLRKPNRQRQSWGAMLDYLLVSCPNIEIPIIPQSKVIAQRIRSIHQGSTFSSGGSMVGNRIQRVIRKINFNVSSDLYLGVAPHFLMPDSTLTKPRKRLFYRELDDEVMLQSLFGLGDFYFHIFPIHLTTLVTYPFPKHMLFPSTSQMIRVRDSSMRNCYLVCEKCQIMYLLPSKLEENSMSSCDFVMKHEKFVSEPFIQIQNPQDDLFIHWKYGQGFAMSPQYYYGVLIVMPQQNGIYAYMQNMIRTFHSNDKQKVLKYFEENKNNMKQQTLEEEAVWLPESHFMDCLPWVKM
jgi:hypothetical protein